MKLFRFRIMKLSAERHLNDKISGGNIAFLQRPNLYASSQAAHNLLLYTTKKYFEILSLRCCHIDRVIGAVFEDLQNLQRSICVGSAIAHGGLEFFQTNRTAAGTSKKECTGRTTQQTKLVQTRICLDCLIF